MKKLLLILVFILIAQQTNTVCYPASIALLDSTANGNAGIAQTLFIDSGKKLGEFSCWSVSLQDLDGDEDLDACIDGQFWINDGKGEFSKSENRISKKSASFGDLNGDGFIDAVCDSSIFLSDGNWNFVKQSRTFGKNVLGARLLCLDKDNDLDAITYTQNSDVIWFNDGKGNFTNSGISLGGWAQAKYETGDINNDGFTDLIAAIPHTPAPEMNDNINDKIWLGDGYGNFIEKALTSTNFQTRSALPADFDGDGDLDLFMGKGFTISGGNNWCKILFNDGSGNFTDSGKKLNTGYNSSDAKIADLDNDGDLDIFIVNGMPTDNGQPNTVWLNDGSGNFNDSGLRLGNSNSMCAALGDIDNDGDIDALTANVNINTGKESVNIYINTKRTPGEIDYLGQTPPGNTPVVFARGVVSTELQNHSVPSFSPDGSEVFWQVNQLDNEKKWHISIMTMRRVEDRWTAPKVSPYAGEPVFSHDGKRIYFASKGEGDEPYFVEKHGDSLSEPKSISFVSRFPELKFVYNLSITRNGTLYFLGHAAGLGSRNDYGIYRAELVNGEYANPELLPACINASSGVLNWTPFIAPDESYLIFSSNRNDIQRSGGDGCDLYISFRKKDGSWTAPVNLDKPINSKELERFPTVSPDGKYLFFTRWTPDYDEDVFWVSTKIIDRLREKSKVKK